MQLALRRVVLLETLAQCQFIIASVTITHIRTDAQLQRAGEGAESAMRLIADCQEWVRPGKAPWSLSAIVTVGVIVVRLFCKCVILVLYLYCLTLTVYLSMSYC